MSNNFFEVLRAGINTTYQDKGRFHMQHLGVAPGGCMDLKAFQIANAIIGKTPTKLFNKKDSNKPCLLSPGDTVRFKSISKKEFENLENEQ